MTKSFGCSDAGVDCNWTTTGENEDEIMEKIKKHAHSDHGFTEIPPDIAQKVKTAIKDV
jgi:predicted small metal-binding protein